jgi:D-lactate dehydrogenase
MARLVAAGDDAPRLAEISAAYDYQGIDTCTACGLCATACPVGIETGLLVKSLRGERGGVMARKAGALVADHMEGTLGLARTGLRLADLARRTVGHGVTQAAARVLTGGNLPALPRNMPTAVTFSPHPDALGMDDVPTVVYAPSCVSRSMGPAASDPQQRPLPEVVESVMRKAGFRILYPEAADGQCCGMPLESKGLTEAADAKADAMLAAPSKASQGGRYPVVMDTSPCALRLKKRLTDASLRILDVAEFLSDFALPRLDLAKTAEPVMLHLTCSTRRMGLDGALTAVAKACAETVVVPPDVGCCGFAGDKGFTTPELNAHALRHLPAAVPEGCASGYSTSRTCEIGLSDKAGVPYRSIVYLVDTCATAKVREKARVAEPAF